MKLTNKGRTFALGVAKALNWPKIFQAKKLAKQAKDHELVILFQVIGEELKKRGLAYEEESTNN